MEIFETDEKEYCSVFHTPYHAFNTPEFNSLNKGTCDSVKYFLFKDKKVRLGFIGGVRDGILTSPFSAPFGGFSFVKEDVGIRQIEEGVFLLENQVIREGQLGIKIALPPMIYSEGFLAKMVNVLYRADYIINDLDLDFYLNLNLVPNYLDSVWYNAKKNTKISLNQDFEFIHESNETAFIEEVYEVIRANRAFRGKPLNMSLQNVIDTSKVIPTDFFLIRQKGINIASAIVYQVAEKILYVPFWGDQPGYALLKPMNFISYKIFEHYYALGNKYVHIGISTENSVPNYGLCEFKESIGCTITPKFTFFKRLNVL